MSVPEYHGRLQNQNKAGEETHPEKHLPQANPDLKTSALNIVIMLEWPMWWFDLEEDAGENDGEERSDVDSDEGVPQVVQQEGHWAAHTHPGTQETLKSV